ncbi:hypothetical protein BDV27DRAFT_140943 [Aspergillus caelatus]|uniref:Uncharacterized protein n=1 Tax=Aspergillus caelatus TaxID=61420 RepID=A0A5N7AIX8_9EURO|nr:uncharacterized protein BDV27DRAFT_140943 [Aspergillus caelatus]KAE8369844.1 hypothetical protein BDV27DRAFT_140943 [Aspergillus caelatus]
MPRRVRPLHYDSVKPFFLWCMHSDHPFEIDCHFDGKSLCRQCSGNKVACNSVAPGMLGNGWDYSQILRWATSFWDMREDDEDENEWPEKVRLNVARALNDLNIAFDKTEMVHRRAHALTSNEYEIKVTYRTFVEQRRQLLVQLPVPDKDAEEDEWECYRSSKLLRLLPGDPGYVLWMVAIRVFTRAIEGAMTCCAVLRGLDEVEGREMVDKALQSFPVMCGEI